MMLDLIPGLKHDIAVECLIRVPCGEIPSLKLVCKDWKTEMELPEFYRARNFEKKAQCVVILEQSLVTRYWYNCRFDPAWISGYFDSVLVFDFLSYKWRRGANMPGGHRWFFACAGDGNGTIYVAGRYDVNENSLNSAWAYHVSTYTWTQLPDMPQERCYCKGLFNLGKFHVINRSAVDRHHQSLEIFDTSSRQWLLLGNGDDADKIIISPTYCVQGTNCKPYTCSANDLVVLDYGNWKFVSRLPADVAIRPCITPFPGHLFLTSKPDYDNPHDAYILDLKDLIWTRLDVPLEYSGHVESGTENNDGGVGGFGSVVGSVGGGEFRWCWRDPGGGGGSCVGGEMRGIYKVCFDVKFIKKMAAAESHEAQVTAKGKVMSPRWVWPFLGVVHNSAKDARLSEAAATIIRSNRGLYYLLKLSIVGVYITTAIGKQLVLLGATGL
ncbi:F-box/kelch-repeat protein-like protein [Tanacetum coccineum]